jgi:hypothetical protein
MEHFQVIVVFNSRVCVIASDKFVHFLNIVTCRGVCMTYRRVLDWMIGFIAHYTHNSELQAITALSLFPHFTVHCYTH